jgi:hypothetical protein
VSNLTGRRKEDVTHRDEEELSDIQVIGEYIKISEQRGDIEMAKGLHNTLDKFQKHVNIFKHYPSKSDLSDYELSKLLQSKLASSGELNKAEVVRRTREKFEDNVRKGKIEIDKLKK